VTSVEAATTSTTGIVERILTFMANQAFIHPEVRQEFVRMKRRIAEVNPGWSAANVEEAARNRLWVESGEATAVLLEKLAFCPVSEQHPIEEYERALQMEEVLDEQFGEYEEEEF